MNAHPLMKKDEDPKPTTAEINAEHEKFINVAKPVANKPKPAPPKEEPKKEEPAKTDADKATTEPSAKNPDDMEIEKWKCKFCMIT